MSAFIDQHTAALADFFIKGLESGQGPIRRKWDAGTIPGYAHNFTTGQPYHGSNQWSFLAALEQLAERGVDPSDTRFGTYKQAMSVGAQVRKGEKAFVGVKYVEFRGHKQADAADTIEPEEPGRPRLVAVPFFVFHASQIMRAAQDVEKILAYMKVPELQYEKVPVIEQPQEQEQPVEVGQKVSRDRARARTRSKGQEITLTL